MDVNSTQLRRALERLELSQTGAARLFGVTDRTVRTWASGQGRIPESIAILLRLMLQGKVTAEDIEGASKRTRA